MYTLSDESNAIPVGRYNFELVESLDALPCSVFCRLLIVEDDAAVEDSCRTGANTNACKDLLQAKSVKTAK